MHVPTTQKFYDMWLAAAHSHPTYNSFRSSIELSIDHFGLKHIESYHHDRQHFFTVVDEKKYLEFLLRYL